MIERIHFGFPVTGSTAILFYRVPNKMLVHNIEIDMLFAIANLSTITAYYGAISIQVGTSEDLLGGTGVPDNRIIASMARRIQQGVANEQATSGWTANFQPELVLEEGTDLRFRGSNSAGAGNNVTIECYFSCTRL